MFYDVVSFQHGLLKEMSLNGNQNKLGCHYTDCINHDYNIFNYYTNVSRPYSVLICVFIDGF